MKRISTRWVLSLAPAAALLCAAGAAAAPARADVDFMKKAAQAGDMEMQASTLAQDKASGATVKDFAAQMLKDHNAAAADLKQLAQEKGVDLPTAPASSDKKQLESLGRLSGTAFDRAYADNVGVKAHIEAVTLFRNASQKASDADVKAFALKTLPTLEHHLDMARRMDAELKGSK